MIENKHVTAALMSDEKKRMQTADEIAQASFAESKAQDDGMVEHIHVTGSALADGVKPLAEAFSINIITGTSGADLLKGTSGDDSVEGLSGQDTIYTYAGNDILNGGLGADSMFGGTGNDKYHVGDPMDTVTELSGEGDDTIISTLTQYQLGNNVENLLLSGWMAVTGKGNELNNQITGNDKYNFLTGEAGDDMLSGGGGNDVLVGGEGNDTLIGGFGDDDLFGGTGNDVYYLESLEDFVVEYENEGRDKVIAAVSYSLGVNVEDLELQNNATALNGTGNSVANRIDGNTYNNVLVGNEGNDTLYGNEGNDLLRAGLGYDVLYGGIGDDTLDGGGGPDNMFGGAGNDIYYVSNKDDRVYEYDNEGDDTVHSTLSYILGSHVENLVLTGTAAIDGTGNELSNIITGNSANNTLCGENGDDVLLGGVGFDILYGGNGSDTLDGGAGPDTMYGGFGNDLYYVSHYNEQVIEYADQGTDTVIALDNYTLAGNVENLHLYASNGTGNDLDNILTYFGSGSCSLSGLEGNDTLHGGAGNDTLAGDSGADVMVGGAGNDFYHVDNVNDVITEFADGGIDTVSTTVDYTLASHIENAFVDLTYLLGSVNLIGNALDNSMTGGHFSAVIDGGAGNDSLRGGGAHDTIYGGAGNDTLNGGPGLNVLRGGQGDDLYYHHLTSHWDSIIIEEADEGHDTVISSGWSSRLSDHVEDLILAKSSQAVVGVGNSFDNTIIGNERDNTLIGGEGHDTIYGHGGNDSITGNALSWVYGGDGNDTLYGLYMYGGEGDDLYYSFNSAVIVERPEQGIDTVITSGFYTLDNNIENVIFTAGSIGTGNFLNNSMTGSSRSDTMFGNDGNDILYGADGNDNLYGDNGNDIICGGNGLDQLGGGKGSDTFAYIMKFESLLDTPDRILDFLLGEDKIDVSAIDANETAAGHQSFTFIGSNAFDANTAGQLRFEYDSGTNIGTLYGNTTLGGQADFAIELAELSVLNATGLIL